MADITEIKDEIAQDEQGKPIPISKKNGEPYLSDVPEDDPEVLAALAESGGDAPPPMKPCTITVLGSDAKRVQAARDENQRKLMRARRLKLEPADLRANRIRVAAAAIVGWFGWTYGRNKDPFPCTPENVKTLLSSEHILEQVEAGISEHSDFFTSASSS